RRFGLACCALYWSRGCGPLNPRVFASTLALQRQRARLLGRYRATIVASRFMEAEFQRHGAPGVVRIPLFVPEPPHADVAMNEAGSLAFVGRLVANKGPELILPALATLKDRGGPLSVIVIGDGYQRQWLEQSAMRLGLQVDFRGWLAPEQRDEVLSSARLLLLPSIWPEPFGLVGLEAARYGVPTVAF